MRTLAVICLKMENNYEKFLGRKENEQVQPILNEFSEKIRQISEIGSKILGWDLEKERSGEEYLLPGFLFLRNQLEIIESIACLIGQSLIDPCRTFLRSALETYIQMDYLFGDELVRGKAFLVWNTHRNIQLYKKMDGVSEEYKQLKAKFDKDRFTKGSAPNTITDSADRIKNAESFLNKKEYEDIEKEYQRLKKLKGKTPNWYSLFNGPDNIEKLANQQSLSGLYEVLYRTWSKSSHGNDIIRGKISKNSAEQLEVIQLRVPGEAQFTTLNCFNLAIMTLDSYVDNRLPEKADDFKQWYAGMREYYLRLNGTNRIKVV
jgi:hypothetical protein